MAGHPVQVYNDAQMVREGLRQPLRQNYHKEFAKTTAERVALANLKAKYNAMDSETKNYSRVEVIQTIAKSPIPRWGGLRFNGILVG